MSLRWIFSGPVLPPPIAARDRADLLSCDSLWRTAALDRAAVAGGRPAAERDGPGAPARSWPYRSRASDPTAAGGPPSAAWRVATGAVLVDAVAGDVGRARMDRCVVVVAVGVRARPVEVEVRVAHPLAVGRRCRRRRRSPCPRRIRIRPRRARRRGRRSGLRPRRPRGCPGRARRRFRRRPGRP